MQQRWVMAAVIAISFGHPTNAYAVSSGGGASCGDGILHERRGEECDDGNADDSDSCSNLCYVNTPLGEGVAAFANSLGNESYSRTRVESPRK
jgi:cysteine-rich repeat protein